MVAAAGALSGEAAVPAYSRDAAVPTYLPALTGLRFFAALWVVLYHIAVTSGQYLGPLVNIGFSGVNFFFVLSGFILAHTYLDEAGGPRCTRRAFWSARFARIYPVYLLALLVAALPSYWQLDPRLDPRVAVVCTLLLVQAWLPWYAGAWDGPGWTLSVETFCYLLFPFLAVRLARLGRRRLNWAAGLLWLAAMAGTLAYILWNPEHLRTWGVADSTAIRLLRFDPLLHLPEFLLGIVLARQFAQDRRRRRAAGRPGHWHPSTAAALAAIAVVALITASGIPLPYLLVHAGLLDPLYGLLIYALAWNRGILAGLLGTPGMLALGEASYALYLLHVPIYGWLAHVRTPPVAGDPAWLGWWGGYLIVSIGLSVLVWYYVGQPARRLLRRVLA